MRSTIEFIQSNVSAFDLIVFLIIFYSIAECGARGFMISLLSFSKWLLALIITIILVPKLNPFVQEYIESKFISDIGFNKQYQIYNHVKEKIEPEPIVLNADNILKNPNKIIKILCNRLNIKFTTKMINWPIGSRNSDGLWGDFWYEKVFNSL